MEVKDSALSGKCHVSYARENLAETRHTRSLFAQTGQGDILSIDRMNISAVIIAKNAEDLIIDCLRSISFCDEITVVDAGSSDKTVKIAREMGAKILEQKTDNFSKLRNFGLEKSSGDLILYIDTDERVTDSLRENIKFLASQRSGQISNIKYAKFVAYRIKRKNFYFGNHEWPYIERLERLFKRDKLKEWRGRLHESPVVDGKIGELDGVLLHYTHRDLASMLEKTIEWSKIEAELRYGANHPIMTWWRFFRVIVTAFLDSYIKQGGWRTGTVGLIESIYQSSSIFITYVRLWEMQEKDKKPL